MTSKTETGHAGGIILSEANGNRSRDAVTIKEGEDLKAGAVLGKITATGLYVAYDDGGTDDGRRTAVAILYADCGATDGDTVATAIVRDAEVNGEELVFASGVDEDGAVTDMASVGIIVRS